MLNYFLHLENAIDQVTVHSITHSKLHVILMWIQDIIQCLGVCFWSMHKKYENMKIITYLLKQINYSDIDLCSVFKQSWLSKKGAHCVNIFQLQKENWTRTHCCVELLLPAGPRLHRTVPERTHCGFYTLQDMTAQPVRESQSTEQRPSVWHAAYKSTVIHHPWECADIFHIFTDMAQKRSADVYLCSMILVFGTSFQNCVSSCDPALSISAAMTKNLSCGEAWEPAQKHSGQH